MPDSSRIVSAQPQPGVPNDGTRHGRGDHRDRAVGCAGRSGGGSDLEVERAEAARGRGTRCPPFFMLETLPRKESVGDGHASANRGIIQDRDGHLVGPTPWPPQSSLDFGEVLGFVQRPPASHPPKVERDRLERAAACRAHSPRERTWARGHASPITNADRSLAVVPAGVAEHRPA